MQAAVRPVTAYQVGDKVRDIPCDYTGTITAVNRAYRSYQIEGNNGERCHVRETDIEPVEEVE